MGREAVGTIRLPAKSVGGLEETAKNLIGYAMRTKGLPKEELKNISIVINIEWEGELKNERR